MAKFRDFSRKILYFQLGNIYLRVHFNLSRRFLLMADLRSRVSLFPISIVCFYGFQILIDEKQEKNLSESTISPVMGMV